MQRSMSFFCGVSETVRVPETADLYRIARTALQIFAREIITPQKVVPLNIFVHWLTVKNYSLYDIKKIFQKCNCNAIYLLYLGQ